MQNDHKKKGHKSITNHRLTRRVNPAGQSKEKNQSGVKFDKKYPDNFRSWTIFRGNLVLLIKQRKTPKKQGEGREYDSTGRL